MTNEVKDQIKNMFYGAMKKAEKLNSIEDKRKMYHEFLERNVDYIDGNVNLKSPEIEEIISEFVDIRIAKPIIFEAEGFVPWLEDIRKDIAWNFYNRYERYLLMDKKWSIETVTDIKKYSDVILDHMANPNTGYYFNKQGLVIGDIQSGKTANYTALINKSIDAGYKIVIVLAGMTKDLRNQTQKRLDKEVLGYETKTSGKGVPIGVGKHGQYPVEGLTYADDDKDFGDMKKFFSIHTLDNNVNPIVAIVKKQKNVLEHLDKFLTSSQSYCYTNEKLDIPVLIIDDEVDQASVDTKGADSIEEASRINGKIRTILSHLNRYSYVGYTATPFANVFIDPDKNDLYPKDFILNLESSSDYCGIKEYFGVDVIANDEYTSDHTKDLFVNIIDYKDLYAKDEKLSARTTSICLPESLKEAIMSFIIASSIKKARGYAGYNSMLIHIARFKNPSTTLRPLVNDYLRKLYSDVKYHYDKSIESFKKFWSKNFEHVSKTRLKGKYKDSWNEIEKFILTTIESSMSNIVVLNGDTGEMLDYTKSKTGDYIVIGGDKLSRGLTIEGLVVSYYYRKSSAYDSLLQMGRWFGYRKGWIDVCRVYTTVRFMNDFINVGKVLQRFKKDVDDMYGQHLNPREVGQRIMYSPNLIPTARSKMKTSTKIKVSFADEVQQVITYDRKNVEDNFKLLNKFVSNLKNGEQRQNNKVVFKDVSSSEVLSYLRSYKECSSYFGYGHISIKNWINYIENLNKCDELTNWTVVLNSLVNKKADYNNSVQIGNYKIYKPTRTLRDDGDPNELDFYTVKANIDPSDFAEFFDTNSKEYKLVDHYDKQVDYPGFDSKHAVISIYVFDLFEKILLDEFDEKGNQKAIRGNIVTDGQSVSGPAIWFPKTADFERSATLYYVSKDYLRKEEERRQNEEIEFGED